MPREVSSDLVHFERVGRVVVLTLDHPPVNVLSSAVIDAFDHRLEQVESGPEARER